MNEGIRRRPQRVPTYQLDKSGSIANPISGAIHLIMDNEKNVRLISVVGKITWAVTQPTPLEFIITVDGIIHFWSKADPVSNTYYTASIKESLAPDAQTLNTLDEDTPKRAFLVEGRIIKIECRLTWATTQPTPLVYRVKWARW